MSFIDVVLIALVVVAVVACVRYFFKQEKDHCIECSSKDSCTHETGHCQVAEDMVARVHQKLEQQQHHA